ncbi:MAG: DUF1330 domain-containing protein [Phreatobacter sp.]|uniref:DUF1330 domain-containing protein n=1 Tax=Phreatobacter sp. TaxID=1966341 RepID=UPI002736D6D9|nr:DUF1330 domain-containing protein [Phreatobacter sp.]MDP2803982.1 DUF1330 domain-containing protein [Phreatobacter sp.]
MTAYAVAHLTSVEMGPAITTYLEAIDATLAPFGGRFVIHGGRADVLEGAWSGDLIVIGFPDHASAADWYGSPAYQAILPLRRDHSCGACFLIQGVDEAHRATDILAQGG